MKSIIVATDYSKAAHNALHYAASLARETGARIILFNAFQLPVHAANTLLSSAHVTKLIDENKINLKGIAAEIIKQYGIPVEVTTTISYVAEELNVLAEQHQADLIVMGIREDSAEAGFLGSVTTYMISNTDFPVLVVPEGTTFTPLKEIAFACDYRALRPDNTLKLLREIAMAFAADVQILHVEKAREPIAAVKPLSAVNAPNLEALFAGVRHTYRDLTDEHILDGIERGVRESNADLLVMVPQHTGFWNMLFNRSRTRRMAQKTHIPLLTLPFKEWKKGTRGDALRIEREDGDSLVHN